MAQILIRDLDSELIKRLKSQAKRHGRSLQGEVQAILEAAASYSVEEARHIAEQWRQCLAGQMVSDSANLIREDRER